MHVTCHYQHFAPRFFALNKNLKSPVYEIFTAHHQKSQLSISYFFLLHLQLHFKNDHAVRNSWLCILCTALIKPMHIAELLLFRPLSQGKRNPYLIKICIGDRHLENHNQWCIIKMQIHKRNKHKYLTNHLMLKSRNMHGIAVHSDTDLNSVV
jgi:hypothetical protein